jgi:ERCC4-type nuclease
LADTREQNVLPFKHPYIEGVERVKLNVGDYAVRFKDGHVPNIYFERKSVGDIFSTMGKGYARFKREMLRAHEAKCTLLIIVEGSLLDIKKGYKHSKIKGVSLIDKLFTIGVRYGVHTIYCDNRKEMSEYITRQFIALGKEHIRRKK